MPRAPDTPCATLPGFLALPLVTHDPTRPCLHCGKKLPAEANFCMACGKEQQDGAAPDDASRSSFALVEDDDGGARAAAQAAPARKPARAPEDGDDAQDPARAIELEDEPETAPDEEAARTAGKPPEADETGDKTIRMPLSDVVQAWAEDAPQTPAPDVDTPKVPLTSNPKFVIAVLIAAAVALGVALAVLT